MSTFGVVLDANVLLPISLCDTLLRLAQLGSYRLFWTDLILEEVQRNLVKKRGVSEEKAQHRIAEMKSFFPQSNVPQASFIHLIDVMLNDPKDHHVLAAAVAAGAQTIVTFNLKDFPDTALAPWNVEAQSPDQFLTYQYSLSPDRFINIIQQQSKGLKRSHKSVADVLDTLAQHAPNTIQLIKNERSHDPTFHHLLKP